MPEPSLPSESTPGTGEKIREIDITDGARALSIIELVRGVARVVCVIAVPSSIFVIISEIHVRYPLESRLIPWILLSIPGIFLSILAFSFAIKTMRPGTGALILFVTAGPALWALTLYSAGFGSWEDEWQEHVPVLFILFVLILPLVIAWHRIGKLDAISRAIARPSPRMYTLADLWRETFGIWPGLKQGKMKRSLSLLFSYLSSLILWVGILILTPLAFLVFLMMRLIIATKGPVDIIGVPLVIVIAFLLLIFVQNGLRTLARWFSRAALAQKVEQDPRPPVLFLRSFQDDQVHLPEYGFIANCYRKIMTLGVGKRRLDHLLVERFSRYGPALALGVPGEKSLPFGAARVYASHENWQEVVHDLANRSGHVILVADSTPGIEWEVETFLNRPLMDKTLFLCAPKTDDIRQSPRIAQWLEMQGIPPGGTPILAVFRDGKGAIVILRCAYPRSSAAFVSAVQAFFRLRN